MTDLFLTRFSPVWLVVLLACVAAPIDSAHAQEPKLLGRPAESADPVRKPKSDPAPSGPFRLVVDLSDRMLYVMRGDDVIDSHKVAVGKPEFPTPKGEFQIRRLVWNPRWVPPDSKWAKDKKPTPPGDPKNPMGKVKIFFKQPDYYIHGTRAIDSLGEAESHGCIRMRNSEVIEIAKRVMEHGDAPRSPSWFQRVLGTVRNSYEVQLAQPVRFTVRE